MKFSVKNVLILLTYVAYVKTDCDICQTTNNVACHNENQYSLCVNGKATEEFKTCPKDYVCTNDRLICSPLSEAKPNCERPNLCGVCAENKVFACLNETTIAFCFGGMAPVDSSLSYCPENTVCDITRSDGYCGSDTLVKPSCISGPIVDIPAGELPPRDANTICQDGGVTGSFKSEEDLTCKKFVVCYVMGSKMQGLTKNCPSGQYFDSVNRVCSINKPEGCL